MYFKISEQDKEELHPENVVDSIRIFGQCDLVYTAAYFYVKTIFHRCGRETYLQKNMHSKAPDPEEKVSGSFFPETDSGCRDLPKKESVLK